MLYLADYAGERGLADHWTSTARSTSAANVVVPDPPAKTDIAPIIDTLWRLSIDDLLRRGPVFDPLQAARQHLTEGPMRGPLGILDADDLAPLFVLSGDAVWGAAPVAAQELRASIANFWSNQQRAEYVLLGESMTDEILNRGFDELSRKIASPSFDVVIAWLSSDVARTQLVDKTILASTYYLAAADALVSEMGRLLSGRDRSF